VVRARPQEGCLNRTREPLPTRVQGLPPLPAEYERTLESGLAAIGVGLDSSAHRAIDDQVRLLLAWNASINLTAIREPSGVALRHVVDSLSALPLLSSWGVSRLLDIGSGAGYPALPLATALPISAGLVESIGKKAAFLRVAAEAMRIGERVTVHGVRVEQLAADEAARERWPVVTARAVASLGDLVELAFPLLSVGGRLVAWKGGDLRQELAAARRATDALGGGQLDVHPANVPGLPDHVLVVVRKRAPTPIDYPRDPATRRRTPWAEAPHC
jgi:16S rRNA (guanine527-N7)-methyltransferase